MVCIKAAILHGFFLKLMGIIFGNKIQEILFDIFKNNF